MNKDDLLSTHPIPLYQERELCGLLLALELGTVQMAKEKITYLHSYQERELCGLFLALELGTVSLLSLFYSSCSNLDFGIG